MSINANPQALHQAAKGIDDAFSSALENVKNCSRPVPTRPRPILGDARRMHLWHVARHGPFT